MKTLATIFTRALIVVVTVFVLYSYYPFASRVLSFLLRSGIVNGSRTAGSVLESFVSKLGVYDTFGIFFGILATLLVFIVPPGMILLLAWRIAKKARFGQKRVHEHPRLPSVDYFGGRRGSMKNGFSYDAPPMPQENFPTPHTESRDAEKVSARSDERTASAENEVQSSQQRPEEVSAQISVGPKNIDEWLERGRISYESGDYEGAVRAYSVSIDLDARGAAYFNRGIAYFKMHHNEEALQDLKAAAGLGHRKSQKVMRSKGVSW